MTFITLFTALGITYLIQTEKISVVLYNTKTSESKFYNYSSWDILDKAYEHLDEQEYGKARTLIRSLKDNTEFNSAFDINYIDGLNYMDVGNYYKAVENFNTIIEESSLGEVGYTYINAYLNRGRSYHELFESGDRTLLNKTIDDYEIVLENIAPMSPENENSTIRQELYYNLYLLYSYLEDYQAAFDCIYMLEDEQDAGEISYEFADLYLRTNELDKALDMIKKSVEDYGDEDFDVLELWVRYYLKTNSNRKALRSIEKMEAQELTPYMEYRVMRSKVNYYAAGYLMPKAKALLSEIIEFNYYSIYDQDIKNHLARLDIDASKIEKINKDALEESKSFQINK